ncbi:unnamed protein product, partial [Amoebophrya sp. A120]
ANGEGESPHRAHPENVGFATPISTSRFLHACQYNRSIKKSWNWNDRARRSGRRGTLRTSRS